MWTPDTEKSSTLDASTNGGHPNQYDVTLVNNFNKKLDETFCSLHEFSMFTDVNKFVENYCGVLNLSKHKLSNTEIRVLSKGLKFCPTLPVIDYGKLKESIDHFFRSLSLHIYFSENNENNNPETKNLYEPYGHHELKLPSTFSPPMPSNLESIYYRIIKTILEHKITKVKIRNLTNSEYEALGHLKTNENIVIKKADKGSNIVIMDRDIYVKEGQRQLGDSKFYKEV